MEQSYAQSAKALINKYKRASFDKLEKQELNDKLSNLADEQEAVRTISNIDTNSQMGNGGPFDYGTYNKILDVNASMPANPTIQDTGLSPYNTSIAPSLLSAGVSTLGNLFLADRSRKYQPELNLPTVTAEQASFAPEREAAYRAYGQAGATARSNVRNAARTRGEYLSNIGAADAGIARGLSDAVGQSYQRESLANMQERARTNAMNAQMRAQEAQFNTGTQMQSKQDTDAYLAAAMQGIPAATRDIAAIQQQDALINSLGENYGMFMQDYPNRKWYQPKKIVRKYRG